MPSGERPSSLRNLVPFRRGHDERRCVTGRPRIGLTLMEWVNSLAVEDADGEPMYTVADLRRIAEAPEADRKHSVCKRAAARALLELLLTGKRGREALHHILNRSLGYPGVKVDVDVDTTKRIFIVPAEDWPKIGAAYLAEMTGAPTTEGISMPAPQVAPPP